LFSGLTALLRTSYFYRLNQPKLRDCAAAELCIFLRWRGGRRAGQLRKQIPTTQNQACFLVIGAKLNDSLRERRRWVRANQASQGDAASAWRQG
jgi:hypothetical protein